jgi:integrase
MRKKKTEHKLNVHTYALMQILMRRSGLRRSDISKLRVADLALGYFTIQQHGSSRKEVHLPAEVCSELKTYLETRRGRRDRSS